jgi:S1-C subfamily serine protease
MSINRLLKLAILSLSVFSLNCVSYTNCVGLDDIKDSIINITHKHNQTLLPYDSFVKIVKQVYDKDGNIVAESVASGIIVGQTKDETKVLTAKHVCNDSGVDSMFPDEAKPITITGAAIDVENTQHAISTIAMDSTYDICLMLVTKIKQPAVQISPVAPLRGEKVFNIAAPLGISDGKAVLLFEGYYAGETFSNVVHSPASLYSIPTQHGSSGSGILNENGELVGITFAGISDFQNVCMAVPYYALVDFLLTVNEQIPDEVE